MFVCHMSNYTGYMYLGCNVIHLHVNTDVVGAATWVGCVSVEYCRIELIS